MVEKVEHFGPLVGRMLLSAIFIISGISKIFGWSGSSAYMAAKGMPLVSFFLLMALLLELLGGFSILVGFQARLSALALFLYLIPTTVIFHNFWASPAAQQQLQMIMFLKNLAIMGGLAQLVAFGPASFSFDARKRRD